MKKYIIAVFVFFVPCITHAITMCARNNSLVGSLAAWSGSNVDDKYSSSEPLWRAATTFGTIFGEATKLSAAEGGEPSGSYSITNVDGNMIPMDKPAGLVGNDENGNPRTYCWCRMTHPMISRWVGIKNAMYPVCQRSCAYVVHWYWREMGSVMVRSVFSLASK